jgi:hypothetical protein
VQAVDGSGNTGFSIPANNGPEQYPALISGGSTGVNCFPAGTPVSTEQGLRPIQDVRTGERVWAFDHASEHWQLRSVLECYQSRHEGDFVVLDVAGETITSTPGHPFWVIEGRALPARPQPDHVPAAPARSRVSGRWVDAGDLQVGDVLLLKEERVATITSRRTRPASEPVYNFQVDDLHCYAVGAKQVLVHNNSALASLEASMPPPAEGTKWIGRGPMPALPPQAQPGGVINWLAKKSLDENGNYVGIGQPGFLASFIPIYGSGRAAIDDFQNGRYLSGAINTTFLALDLTIVGGVARKAVRAGYKPAACLAMKAIGREGSCFAAGTMLLTPDGYKAIEDFQEGDWIISARDNDSAAPPEPKQVESVFGTQAVLYRIEVGGQVIRTTPAHPFYVQGIGWREAQYLKPGDLLRSHDGKWTAVGAVEATGEWQKVYNVSVADYHTYFVGDEVWGFSVWAHNWCDAFHHFVPVFMGNAARRGSSLLTKMLKGAEHKALHDAMYEFLSKRGMNWWQDKKAIQGKFSLSQRLNALKDFYKQYKGGRYFNDFKDELIRIARAGKLR